MSTSQSWVDPSSTPSSNPQRRLAFQPPPPPPQNVTIQDSVVVASVESPLFTKGLKRESKGQESIAGLRSSSKMLGPLEAYSRRKSQASDSKLKTYKFGLQPLNTPSQSQLPGSKLEDQLGSLPQRIPLKKSTLKRKSTIDPSRLGPRKFTKGKQNLEAIERRVFANTRPESQFAKLGARRKEEHLKEQIMKLENKHHLRTSRFAKDSSSSTLVKKTQSPAYPRPRESSFEQQKSPMRGLERKRSMSQPFAPSQFEHARRIQTHELEQLRDKIFPQQSPTVSKADSRALQRIQPPHSPVQELSEENDREISVKLNATQEEEAGLNRKEMSKDLQKLKRMTYRAKQKTCLIYPENKIKGYWDLFMTLVLLVSCILTPVDIAFKQISMESEFFVNLTMIMDILFACDIIVIFNSCYYDDQVQLVEDRSEISRHYLKGWFAIDLFAIIPFEIILSAAAEFNSFVRVARVGRLYKLVKLTRLLRILKIMRDRSRLLRYLHDFLKVGLGFERLFFFLIIFLLMCHIASCLWITIAGLQNEEGFEGTWMEDHMKDGSSSQGIYLTAFYWTATTITTVGYGDITGTNSLERFFCSFMMLVGVIAFSFANGSLASIIQNYDQTNAEYQEKMVVLNKIYKDYCLPLDLYIRLKQSLAYENQKVINDFNRFVEDLPHKLKVEVSLYIYEERYSKLKLFKGQTAAFISWLCPLLRPQFFGEKQYIFQEGDEITGIFFLVSGEASFVLPSYDNTPYININEGDHFGLIDIIGSSETKDFEAEDWYLMRNLLQRQFSVSSLHNAELQTLSLQDLHRLQQEFVDIFEMMIQSSIRQLRAAWIMKLDAMQQCAAQLELMQDEMSEESYSLSAGSIKKHNKMINYDIEPMDLGQIDDVVEAPSNDTISEEQNLDPKSHSQESNSLSSVSEETPTKRRQPEKKLEGDDVFSPASAFSKKSLDLKKATSIQKQFFANDPGTVSQSSLTKKQPVSQGLLKSKSLYIDKKELLSSQPLKAEKQIQEEGQLVLKKLGLRLEDGKKRSSNPTSDRKKGEPSSYGRRKSFVGDGPFSMKKKYSLIKEPGTSQPEKKVTFGEAHFTSSESSSSSFRLPLKSETVQLDDKPSPNLEAKKTAPSQQDEQEELQQLRALVPELRQEIKDIKESQSRLENQVTGLQTSLLEEMKCLKAALMAPAQPPAPPASNNKI